MNTRIAIVINGAPGSGSTTLAKSIARAFGWPAPYYSGGVIRWLSIYWEAHGEDITKLNPKDILRVMEDGAIPDAPRIHELYKTFPADLDRMVDEIQEELLRTKSVGVHEGRLAPYLSVKIEKDGSAPDKIFARIATVVDPRVGARRQLLRSENKGKTEDALVAETALRVAEEKKRYEALYGVKDYMSSEYFDGMIDTTDIPASETLARAISVIRAKFPDADFLLP
ncbi:MAG: hypothetical protein A2847_02915 [Candidatus Sungbacteria bacterium RIFCSPHIGHO2_01_FULL_50_25]|uniref:(d)CMP kinase n=1 Tax=Candidatus Sungbacteria bacterium RIFCSPHIGHO2_01_FULL_50_25 TaxID=1802265 RepID=A0A1G2KAA9_9BACT|nr:MAG: hypothetical protein A2847_02915 [Candidatus Sungbacteria bacterium RIFCSPHIGHO2_01_FULL_50_25]